MVTLLCPVRGCRQPLAPENRRLVCARLHSFDVARRGYVNLLQPQDRRSRAPGDSLEALHARSRVRRLPTERTLIDAIAALVPGGPGSPVLDVGCGDGAQLGAVVARTGCDGYGLDLSARAVEMAATAFPALHWVVANADRTLPYADGSFAAVMSVTARINAPEFARVLQDDGALVIVVPGPDDLIELRQAVLGQPTARERTARVIEACTPAFAVDRIERLRGREWLDRAALGDVLAASYRGARTRERDRAAALDGMDVTFARDVAVLRRRTAAH